MKDRAQFWEGPQSSGEEDRLEKELLTKSIKLSECRDQHAKTEKELLILQTNFNAIEKSYCTLRKENDELDNFAKDFAAFVIVMEESADSETTLTERIDSYLDKFKFS